MGYGERLVPGVLFALRGNTLTRTHVAAMVPAAGGPPEHLLHHALGVTGRREPADIDAEPILDVRHRRQPPSTPRPVRQEPPPSTAAPDAGGSSPCPRGHP